MKLSTFRCRFPSATFSPVLAPFARKNALAGSVGWHGTHRLAEQRQSRRLIQPRSVAFAGGEQLVEQRGKDHADNGLVVEHQSNAHTKHGGRYG